MTKSLFRQSFLFDSLDLEQEVLAGQTVLGNGVQLKVHQRGVFEVIPADYDQQTKNIIFQQAFMVMKPHQWSWLIS